MFQSSFKEGDEFAANQEADTPLLYRRQINMKEDFDVVHNTIYFLYTGEITFSLGPNANFSAESKQPQYCDAVDIYELARRLELQDLAGKALEFLKLSCDTTNVVELYLSLPASIHDDLDDIYSRFLQKHSREIRPTIKPDELVNGLEKEDKCEVSRVFRRFVKLIKLTE